MNQIIGNHQHKIGIVGGGMGGLKLFQLFLHSPLTKVVFVVDTNLSAPAIEAARAANVAVFNDISEALTRVSADFVYEATGSTTVIEMLKEKLTDSSAQLVTHSMASVTMGVIEEIIKRSKNDINHETSGIKKNLSDSLRHIDKLVESIDEITSEMRILALNARIEAARVGEGGKGFAVVAQQMAKSVESVRNVNQEIETVNQEIRTISDMIENVIEAAQPLNILE